MENTTSLCQTTASPGGVWTAQLDPQNSRWQAGLRPVSPPTKEKVIQMSQLNSWILFIPFCLGSTVCTLVMVFQNNTILNGKALDDATLDEMELSHTLPWFPCRAMKDIKASKQHYRMTQWRILIGIIQLRKWSFFFFVFLMKRVIKYKSKASTHFNLHFWCCIP